MIRKNEFPKHFYEPIRRKIASEVMQKELRKLLPEVLENLWPKIDANIEEWFDKDKFELALVQDFWDGFEGISQGFKCKNLLPYITAENIQWRTLGTGLNNLIFMTDLPIYEKIFKAPFKNDQLIDYLQNPQNKEVFLKFKKDSDQHAKSSAPRDSYPIILLKVKDGFKILDGHRRIIRAIVYHQPGIKAHVGQFGSRDEIPKNFWISIGFLRNITRIADLNRTNKDIVSAVTTLLKNLYQDHENVRLVFKHRILESQNFSKKLRDRLRKEIIDAGIV